MKKKTNKIDQRLANGDQMIGGAEFNNGIWYCIQELVVTYDHPNIAKQIIKEAGLSKAACGTMQAVSGSFNMQMNAFINTEL